LSEPAAAGDGAAAAGEGDDPRDVGCDLVPTRRELRRVAGAFESDIVQIQKEVSHCLTNEGDSMLDAIEVEFSLSRSVYLIHCFMAPADKESINSI